MRKLSFFLGLVACVVIFLIVSATPAFAQGETGSVDGAVLDSQGAAVAGADVTLIDTATKSSRTTTTNESGRYHFSSVAVGTYDITISKTGFKVHKAAAQKVSVGVQLTLDVTLEVGSLTETVVVTSQAGSELQTTNATIGNTISLKDLELLPNLGRDASTLMALQPGVTARGDVAGSYMDQNTFTIDGGNNTDDMAGNTIGYIQNFTGITGSQTNGMASGVVATPIESVEEFKVNTVGQTADFNSSAGAQVMMVTRRGNDQWHGSGYGYYFGTNHGGANSWENNHTTFNKGLVPPSRPACSAGTTYSKGDNNCVMPYTPIIPNHRSRFGFSLGGPATKLKVLGGKTYFFVNYEGFRYPNATTFERAYPTAAFRAGVIQVPDSNGVYQPYNLNPFPVTVTVGSAAKNDVRTVTLPGLANGVCPTAGPTYTGTTTACDPRNLGMSPIISQLWNKYLPLPNDPIYSGGDGYNTQGYLSTIRLPLTSNNYVGRIDHDFGPKHRFFTSFRAFKLLNYPSNVQVDVGGLISGGSVGTYSNSAQRPQLGELWVTGLTSNLSPRVTNDLRVSYLWNWWQWATSTKTSQLPGVGGAQGALLEIAPAGTGGTAESTGALIPFNVNTQSVRQRVWDGQDKMIRDDVTWVKGNHLIQFGGLYQRNHDYHTRTDNGSTVNNQIVYQIAYNSIGFNNTSGITCLDSHGNALPTTQPAYIPCAVSAAGQQNLYQNLAASVFGLVGLTQVIYTRAGSDLSLQPLGTLAQQISTIPTYNVYMSDTWRFKPTVTINYGLGYTLEMPPVEKQGRQVELVFPDGSLVHTDAFLAKRKEAALQGQAYAPILGFETTGNLKLKHPYKPFYGGISPRISVAWNPNFKSGFLRKIFGDGQSVLRGGYNLAYGRLNGVNLVLVPLLGPGPLQSVTCGAALSNGTCGTSNTLANAFRIGPDGLMAPLASPTATLPQPYLPGVSQNGILNPAAGDATVLDPDYKPEKVHSFDFTIQRNIGRRFSLEVGYIGKKATNIFEEINLDSVPYMMTAGGQQFANAWANMYIAICGLGPTCAKNAYTGPVQPFFEAALTPGSGYCATFTSCTAAVASKQTSNFQNTTVSAMWATLNAATGWKLGRTMLSSQATAFNTTTSLGFSNYNAAFISMRMRDLHGFSGLANFTWGKALGTGEIAQYNSSNEWLDNWNPHANYGPAVFDYKYLFNAGMTYRPPFFRGRHGWTGKLLDGWGVSPFLFVRSGAPIRIGFSEGGTCSSNCQAFGSSGNPSTSGSAFEGALPINPNFVFDPHATRGVPGSNGIGTNNSTGVNMFADPAAFFANFRRCVLGYDTSCGGINNLRGLSNWNLDATLSKEVKFTERIGVTLTVQFTNVLNHWQPADPTAVSANNLSLTTPTQFGRITASQFNPRQMEIGARIHF